MKILIIVLPIVYCLLVAFGGDGFILPENTYPSDQGLIFSPFEERQFVKTDPESIHNKQEVIQYFIDSGDVCEVIGHVWEVYDPCAIVWNEGLQYGYSVTPCLGPKTRTCQICGLKQKESFGYEKIEVEKEVKEWINVE